MIDQSDDQVTRRTRSKLVIGFLALLLLLSLVFCFFAWQIFGPGSGASDDGTDSADVAQVEEGAADAGQTEASM